MKYVKFTKLDNGLTVITDFNPSIETVFSGVWVSVGSRNETEDIKKPAPKIDKNSFMIQNTYDYEQLEKDYVRN